MDNVPMMMGLIVTVKELMDIHPRMAAPERVQEFAAHAAALQLADHWEDALRDGHSPIGIVTSDLEEVIWILGEWKGALINLLAEKIEGKDKPAWPRTLFVVRHQEAGDLGGAMMPNLLVTWDEVQAETVCKDKLREIIEQPEDKGQLPDSYDALCELWEERNEQSAYGLEDCWVDEIPVPQPVEEADG